MFAVGSAFLSLFDTTSSPTPFIPALDLHVFSPLSHPGFDHITACWDGSFSPAGAGIGLTLHSAERCLLSASIPVVASDATRVEALGPPLIALLASQLSPRRLQCSGDSLYVVSLLQRRFRPSDVFLFNCVELTFDLLLDTHILVHWIPREQNSVCDALAR